MFVERKQIVYVGGLTDNVNEEVLHAAFIPFGDLKSIQIPRDYKNSKFVCCILLISFFFRLSYLLVVL
jgi:hypothetical protein